MSVSDPVSIGVETPKIINRYSLEEFSKWIYMDPWMVLYLTINQVDWYHNCLCDPLT